MFIVQWNLTISMQTYRRHFPSNDLEFDQLAFEIKGQWNAVLAHFVRNNCSNQTSTTPSRWSWASGWYTFIIYKSDIIGKINPISKVKQWNKDKKQKVRLWVLKYSMKLKIIWKMYDSTVSGCIRWIGIQLFCLRRLYFEG